MLCKWSLIFENSEFFFGGGADGKESIPKESHFKVGPTIKINGEKRIF